MIFLFLSIASFLPDKPIPDKIYSQTIEFIVTVKENGEWGLSSQTTIIRPWEREISIVEPYFAPIHQLAVWVGGRENRRRLNPQQIEVIQPEFKDILIHDLKIHRLHLDSFDRGTIVTYNYEQIYQGLEFLPTVSIPNLKNFNQYEIRFRHAPTIAIHPEIVFTMGEIPFQIEKNPGNTRLIFVQLPFKKARPFDPLSLNHAQILFSIKDKDKNITHTDPIGFSKWYESMLKDIPPLSAVGKARAEEIVKGELSPHGKLMAIHNFVKKIGYIADEEGWGAIVPRPPDQVLSNGFGDCKDRAFLVTQMAKSLGLNVKLALISTKWEPEFKGVNLNLFNHMIYAWKTEGQWSFSDPTAEYEPFGSIPYYETGKPVFVVGEGWMDIGMGSESPDLELIIHWDVGHLLQNAKATLTLRNQHHSRALAIMGAERSNIALEALVNPLLKGIYLSKIKPVLRDRHSSTWEANIDMTRFVTRVHETIYFSQTPFSLLYEPTNQEIRYRNKDNSPLFFEEPCFQSVKLVLNHPGFKLDGSTIIPGTSYFHTSVKQDSDQSEIHFLFQRRTNKIMGETRNKYLRNLTTYRKVKQKMITLKQR